ncbi:MAG: DUF4347 domain-containing protein [Pseudomonadota bacterium]
MLEPRVLFDAAIAETVAVASGVDATADAGSASADLLTAIADIPAAGASITEVVFIDSRVEGASALAQQMQASNRSVFILDDASSGLEQMSRLLSPYDNLSGIHIVSHGSDGALLLGSGQVSSATLLAESGKVASLGAALSEQGDILLYGCDIASTEAGKQFVARLGQLSGADVAASDDTTGTGGDLDLEFTSGPVEQQIATAFQSYGGNLSLEAYNFANDNGDAAGHNLGQFMEGSGEWVVVGTDGGSEAKLYKVVGSTLTEYDVAAPGTANGGATVTWTATFGQGVAIQGDTMVIVDPNATFTTDNAGAAHANGKGVIAIYQLDNTITSGNPWVHVRTVKITNAAANSGIGPWGTYGSYQYVAVDGNHIAIGAPNEGSGSGRVYWVAANTQNATTGNWDWAAAITLGKFDEATRGDSNDAPRFGATVDIAKSGLIVGAPEWDQNNDDTSAFDWTDDNNHGRVFVYQWDEGTTAGPTSGDAYSFVLNGNPDTGGGLAKDAHFGTAVAIEYNAGRYTFVVGAPQEDGDNGEVYLYQTAGSSLGGSRTVSNLFQPLNYDVDGQFGSSVALSQAKMLIGSNNNSDGTKASIWYFEDADGIWPTMNTAGQGNLALTPNAMGYLTADEVGRSLALVGGNLAIIGASMRDNGGTDTGNIQFRYIRTPVAVSDAGVGFSATENGGMVNLNILANDVWGSESSTTTPVTIVSGSQNGAGTFVWNNTTRRLEYNPGSNFEYLSVGDSAIVSVKYQLTVGSWISQGTVVVSVTGQNDVPQASAALTNVTVPLTNEPVGTPAGPSTASTGNIAIPANTFFDIDQNDILTYTLVSVTPVGAAPAAPTGFVGAVGTVYGSYNNSTGVNTGNIAYNLAGMTANTSYTITVRASDGQGGTATTSFTFNVARANQNPELVGAGVPNFTDAVEDSTFTKNLTGYFTDPDSPVSATYPEVLTYSIVSQTGPGASWLSVSSGGSLSGAASNDNVGVHTVVVRATDIFGNYIQDTFTVTVGNTNDAPVLTNDIDRKVAIRGETFSFNVTSGVVSWNGAAQPVGDTLPYFTDIDNSTADGRSPASGDVITYRAYDALTGQEITSTAGSTNASWLRFNGTSFTGTPDSALGKVITIRLDAIDRLGGAAGPIGGTTSTLFEIGVFPRDGSGAIGTGLPGIENGGRLGFDTAINSDSGRWMVVGEPGGANGSGEIHIYENTAYGTAAAAPTWVARISFSTAAVDARLGTAVDISADGRFIVAGAPLENGGAGAVYYFSNTTQVAGGASGTWAAFTTAKGVSPDAAAGDRFGSAVAINENGGVVLVGAPQDDEAGTNAGAAYQFAFGAATGAGKRLPTVDSVGESRAGDLYGSSVAFDQNMVVVGAPRDDHSGKADAGSAYVYSTDNTSVVKLKKTDGVAQSDYFGTNVDVESFDGRNRVVVVVGTPNDDALANNAGAVYVYRSDGMVADNGSGDNALTSLVLQSRITAYDGDALENFGYSVAVDVQGDTAAGALRIAVGGDLNGTSPGSAYAYRYYVVGGVSGWVGQRYLATTDASTVSASNQYGFSVDIAGSRFVVGAPNADRTVTSAAGLYYSFNVATGSPIETAPASFSGAISKELGTGQPSPLMLGSQDSLFPATVGSLDQGHLEELLKPVQSWRLDEAAANQPLADTESRRPAGASLAEDLLFDLRTLKGKKLARLADPMDARLLELEAAPQGEAPAEAPATEGAAPAAEGQEALPAAPVQEAAAMSQGFSLQLQAVQAARSRQQADRLLSSLSSLSA